MVLQNVCLLQAKYNQDKPVFIWYLIDFERENEIYEHLSINRFCFTLKYIQTDLRNNPFKKKFLYKDKIRNFL